jgi:hypothetical protein
MAKKHQKILRPKAYSVGKPSNVMWGEYWNVYYFLDNSTKMSFVKVIHDMYKMNPKAQKISNMPCACCWGLHITRLHLRNVIECNHKLFVVVAYMNYQKWCVLDFWFNKMKFYQGVMVSCVITFEIWVILGFSLNMIRISQVLVHFHWYCTILLVHMLKLYVATLTLGLWLSVKCKGPWVKRMCSCVKHTFTNGGECKRWSPMTLKCTPTLGVAFVWKSWRFKALVEKANKHSIRPPRYHWKGLEVKRPKVSLHCSFRTKMHKLWPRERSRVKLGILLPTTNSLRVGVKSSLIGVWNTPLEKSL